MARIVPECIVRAYSRTRVPYSGVGHLTERKLSPLAIERAVRLSYVQAMSASVYAASTGGMFIIGYALKLGATDAQLGLMTTVPMLAVVMQLVASIFIERGVSRRRMTIVSWVVNIAAWPLLIVLPYALAGYSSAVKLGAMIAVITLATIFANVAANARGSWIGDLIPEDRRGEFFGKSIMYSGIIGTLLAIVEGTVLDHVKKMGISAFGWLFAFGMAFGLITTLLFIAQADVRTEKHSSGGKLSHMVAETFKNRAVVVVMLFSFLWSLQAIAAPFYATYVLRDLKVPFVGLGVVSSMVAITMLVSSPFWGNVIDRYGCRPVLTACAAVVAPLSLLWIWVSSPGALYWIIGPANLLSGFAVGGISVALNTLIYKVTPNAGRSGQLAVYSSVVVLLAAPMPSIGGHLPGWLHSIGIHSDIRCTFYTCTVFATAAAFVSRYIHEPGSRSTSELVAGIPGHIAKPATLKEEENDSCSSA